MTIEQMFKNLQQLSKQTTPELKPLKVKKH